MSSAEIAVTGLTVKDGLLSGLPVIASFASPSTGILLAISGGSKFALIFQNQRITTPGSYNFTLSPGVYEVWGEMISTVLLALGNGNNAVPKVAANSIKSLFGPSPIIAPCFIAYTTPSTTDYFGFQFTVSADNVQTCDGRDAENSFFAQSSNSTDYVRTMRFTAQEVIVGGTTGSNRRGQDLFVRSYDARTGVLRWRDQMPAADGLSTSVFISKTEDMVFFAGYVSAPVCCSSIFVRRYDLNSGRILWTDIYNKGRDALPQGIAATSAAVVVVGYGGNTAEPPISGLDFLVRAYDPATGSPLWEDRVDHGFFVDDAAWAVRIDDTRVLVAGTSSMADGVRNEFLRTYDVSTGTLFSDTY
jgi:hypothetical protein